MNTKIVMTVCAIILGVIGIILTFMPQETAAYFQWPVTNTILFQILGALFMGFAMINWISKNIIIGGIYGRAIVVGNFTHFFIGALALIKLATRNKIDVTIILITIIYAVFAIIFGYLLFNGPKVKNSESIKTSRK